VTDVDLEAFAGVVFHHTEVVILVIWLGMSNDLFELPGGSLFGSRIFDVLGTREKFSDGVGGLGADADLKVVFGAGRFARKLEGVLNSLALLFGVATFRNFRVVGLVKELRRCRLRFSGDAIRHPDVDDGKLGVAHALGNKDGRNHGVRFHIIFFDTLSFSEGSRVVLGENTRDHTTKSIFDSESDMCGILIGDRDRDLRVNGFSFVGNQDGIRWRTSLGR